MLKHLFLIGFFSTMATPIWSQSIQFPINENGEVEYTNVVQVNDVDQNELFSRAKEWFAISFKSAQNVLQMDDRTAGKLIGKGLISAYGVVMNKPVDAGYIDFIVEIQVKDGRFKYSFHSIRHRFPIGSNAYTPGVLSEEKPGGGIQTMGKKYWDGLRHYANEDFIALENSLIEAMTISKSRSDDW